MKGYLKKVLNIQLGNVRYNRFEVIDSYRKAHNKCPRCGSEKIGITYTTGTGRCFNCESFILLSTRGLVALTRHKNLDGVFIGCHFWFEEEGEMDCKDCIDGGPVFCGTIDTICL